MTIAMYVVIAAAALPALIYLALAFREAARGLTLGRFFPLSRFVPAGAYGRSTAAAGVSLATVILALVNLSPVLGLGLLITVASYVGGFMVLYWVAPHILRANPDNHTLQSYLGSVYGPGVKYVSIAFTFVGYMSIFSMEILVGVSVLEPIFPGQGLPIATLFLAFIVLYSTIGGFRAIVATEQWQIRFVVAAVAALVLTGVLLWFGRDWTPSAQGIVAALSQTWAPGWAFALGIVAMNLPAAVSDAATWQRLCATASEQDARRGLRQAMVMFAAIWGTLIVASCFIGLVAAQGYGFDASKQPLMDFIMSFLAGGGVLSSILLFVFVLGLLAALVTTADSLMLVAAQMLSLDVLKLDHQTGSERGKVFQARLVLALVAAASFGLFALFRILKLDVVSLVFAIYGAQLALFPTVAFALMTKNPLARRAASSAAVISILGGFAAGWAAALYGRFTGAMTWTYDAPAVALAVALLLFVVARPLLKSRVSPP